MIKFGPAGNSLSFYEQGGKSTVQAMPWIAELGLNAYEYSCGKGINVGEDTALKIGAAAAECGVEVRRIIQILQTPLPTNGRRQTVILSGR